MRRIDDDERRARLGLRHHLASAASDVTGVAGDIVGLHSTDPVTPYLAARARVPDFTHGHLEDALYEQRSLVRILGMRRTMFVLPLDIAEVIDAACAKDLLARERKRLVAMLEEQELVSDADAWLSDVGDRVLEALAERGLATAAELTSDVPELAVKISFGEGKRWAGQVGVSTRLLFLLATAGRIVRTRPRGSWVSTQYRWALTSSWLGSDLEPREPSEARAELARRWLAACGPGTLTDLKWWTGWTVAQTRAALAAVDAVEVDLEGDTGYVLPDDLDPVRTPKPWVALLPALDPTVMAWKQRDFFLGDLAGRLFDTNGNAGPTVWAGGRVVGGWAQGSDGAVVVELLADVGATAERKIQAEAGRLQAWLGEARITPRFRTPLERELSGR